VEKRQSGQSLFVPELRGFNIAVYTVFSYELRAVTKKIAGFSFQTLADMVIAVKTAFYMVTSQKSSVMTALDYENSFLNTPTYELSVFQVCKDQIKGRNACTEL